MMNYTEFVKEACSTLSFPANATTCFLGVEWDLTQNADLAAAQIAAKLGAKKLILMTDIRGLLRDVHDDESLIPVVNVSEVPMLKRDGIISGGMIPKIDCCVEAVRSGVNRAHIIDGRLEHSIILELFSDEGIGTMFYQL